MVCCLLLCCRHELDTFSKIIRVTMVFPFTMWQTKEAGLPAVGNCHIYTQVTWCHPQESTAGTVTVPKSQTLTSFTSQFPQDRTRAIHKFIKQTTSWMVSPGVTQNRKPAQKAPSGCRLKCKCTWKRGSRPSWGVYASRREPLGDRGSRKLKR